MSISAEVQNKLTHVEPRLCSRNEVAVENHPGHAARRWPVVVPGGAGGAVTSIAWPPLARRVQRRQVLGDVVHIHFLLPVLLPVLFSVLIG
jgi:hypothetical protein